MNSNTYDQPGVLGGHLGQTGLISASPDPQRISPIQEAIATLLNSISAAQKMQETLEQQLSSACACYSVNPFSDGSAEVKATGSPINNCMLQDQIEGLVRMVNSLVDRQEAMSRHIQL